MTFKEEGSLEKILRVEITRFFGIFSGVFDLYSTFIVVIFAHVHSQDTYQRYPLTLWRYSRFV